MGVSQWNTLCFLNRCLTAKNRMVWNITQHLSPSFMHYMIWYNMAQSGLHPTHTLQITPKHTFTLSGICIHGITVHTSTLEMHIHLSITKYACIIHNLSADQAWHSAFDPEVINIKLGKERCTMTGPLKLIKNIISYSILKSFLFWERNNKASKQNVLHI